MAHPNRTELEHAQYLHSGSGNLVIGGSFVPAATPPTSGSNLPHPHPAFLGRTDELNAIACALSSRAWIVTVDGMGGVGKTTLVLQAAHHSRSGLPGFPRFDAYIWISARAKSHFQLSEVFAEIIAVLSPELTPPASSSSHPMLAKRLLASKACLLIIDNFESVTDEALFRFLRDE